MWNKSDHLAKSEQYSTSKLVSLLDQQQEYSSSVKSVVQIPFLKETNQAVPVLTTYLITHCGDVITNLTEVNSSSHHSRGEPHEEHQHPG